MFLNNSFGKTMDLLHRSMDVGILRHEVLANNMANVGTDHFKRSDLTFETALKAALDSENPAGKFPAHRPDSERADFAKQRVDYSTVRPKKVLDFLTTSKSNGNNVDPDVEASKALHNQLIYQLMTQVASSHYNQINLVLRG
ncbi:MAG: flagellar basal body rod protein FlgB [Spirochaetales bacterium]|jgi:flagellar basal-body rod protein FlgB|nr:flagellar basal body rod protein FlgB [Spirochaetales bacterium]